MSGPAALKAMREARRVSQSRLAKRAGFDALVRLQWDAMQSVGGDAATIMADAVKIQRDLDATPGDTAGER